MRHSHRMGLFFAILAALSILNTPSAGAQTAGIIEQNFASSLTAIPNPPALKRIAYFDTSGKIVESYPKSPAALKPFSTIGVFVAANDVRGGTGANFVVDWAATGEIAEPAVEALMVGSVGPGHDAFIGQGRPIRIVSKN
jgi:Protein of unknown function (DUF3124)